MLENFCLHIIAKDLKMNFASQSMPLRLTGSAIEAIVKDTAKITLNLGLLHKK